MKSIILILALIGASLAIEMPSYSVISQLSQDVEIRRYPQTKWASTSSKGTFQEASSLKNSLMFGKLFAYISGQNDQSQKIDMTSPVTTLFKNSDNRLITADSNVVMTMRFLVPKINQDNVPNPTGDAFIMTDPETEYATIRFSGWATMNDYLSHRDLLIQVLGASASQYDTVNFITAGYNDPFTQTNRRNEVWLRKL